MNYGMMNNTQMMNYNIPQMNIPQMNPYQQKFDRLMDLQQQNQSMNINQQQNQVNTNMNFVVVENIQKAKEQVVPCGFTMWMRDSNEPYQYIKSVDAIGTPSFKVLKFEDVTEEVLNGNSIKQQEIKTEQFVKVEDYNKLNETVIQLQNTVNYYSNVLNKVINPTNDKDADYKEIKKVNQTRGKKVSDE